MKVGFIGSAADVPTLAHALTVLFDGLGCHKGVYLGDHAPLVPLIRQRQQALACTHHGHADPFLCRAAALWRQGDPAAIQTLLRQERQWQQLHQLFTVPTSHRCGVELMGDKLCLLVHNKAWLDQDDIYNSTLVVYGGHPTPAFRRIGQRCFFCPGPVAEGQLGVLDLSDERCPKLSAIDLQGQPLWCQPLARVSVQFSLQGQ
ncbi:MAG: hypothetical protein ACPGUV_06565 [Polyangiales bacterium]